MKKAEREKVAGGRYWHQTVARESLPFPIVIYPSGGAGAFFGFRETEHSPIVLCACAREAVENCARLRMLDPHRKIWETAPPHVNFVLSSNIFPRLLVESLIGQRVPDDHRAAAYLRYGTGLCHECNQVVPTHVYLPRGKYGSGDFYCRYAWYIRKQAYDWGLDHYSWPTRILWDVFWKKCPAGLREFIKWDPGPTQEWVNRLVMIPREDWSDEAERISEEFATQKRLLGNAVENQVREKFGHKKIGEGWTSETTLYYMVRSLHPEMTIHRHYRPDFLEGLELDIFIEEAGVGIEYQGVQHFEPVEHWGGVDGLAERQAHDKRKREICASLGIPIVYFQYDEPLTEDLVRGRLDAHIRDS